MRRGSRAPPFKEERVEYVIVFGEDPQDLACEVMSKIAEGFVPMGGVSTAVVNQHARFYQALAKSEKKINVTTTAELVESLKRKE